MVSYATQMLHVGNIYLHFPLNVAIFHLMYVNNPYMEHLGYGARKTGSQMVVKASEFRFWLIPRRNGMDFSTT